MNFWQKYQYTITTNIDLEVKDKSDLTYVKHYMFLQALMYIVPLSLIALIPGIIYSIVIHAYSIAIADFIAFIGIFFSVLPSRLNIHERKWLFVGSLYFIAVVLIVNLGLFGAGLIYLLFAAALGMLFFSKKYAFVFAWLNTAISLVFTAVFYWFPFRIPGYFPFTAEHWFAVSSNVIFVSFVEAFLIPELFNRMDFVLQKQVRLKNELQLKAEQLNQLNHQYKLKNSELEQFTYVASHDLQEPLRMISSFMSQLDKKYGDQLDEKGKQYVHFALDGAARMRQVMIELMAFSRVEIESQGPKERIDVSAIIEEIIWLNRKVIQEKNTQFVISELLPVEAHTAQIRTLFTNLILNAVKYSSKARDLQITISCEAKNDYVIFAVKDNGIGIEKSDLDSIFQLFKRGNTPEESTGNGIGLAICKKICNLLGGSIWVVSEKEVGSTFYCSLPTINLKQDAHKIN